MYISVIKFICIFITIQHQFVVNGLIGNHSSPHFMDNDVALKQKQAITRQSMTQFSDNMYAPLDLLVS